ncbi:MAG: phage holin family protein [Synechococcaceae cyanobacterium]|nr:phage holin family protein [Synechococcaceae cyanobacterium]
MSGLLVSLLQWPIRAIILIVIAQIPFLGVEMASFSIALISAVVIGLLGVVLTWPLKFILGPAWAITTLAGLIPIGWLFDWLITIILFGLAAWLIQGFRLRNGLLSAALGALVYSVLCFFILNAIPGLNVRLTGAAALFTGAIG